MGKYDELPNVRDGLTRKERIILHCINTIQNELGGRNVPTAMLYGRVVEYMDISVEEMQSILQRLIDNKS
jgi:predicted HTH domain antitoxin